MSIELDKIFNAHKDKTREGQEDTCMAYAHDVTKTIEGRNRNLQKKIPRNPVRGATGRNNLILSRNTSENKDNDQIMS